MADPFEPAEDDDPATLKLKEWARARSAFGDQDQHGLAEEAAALAQSKRTYAQQVEWQRKTWELNQARAAGVISPEEYEEALSGDRSSWLQKALGLAHQDNTGGFLETTADVLSLGNYLVASGAEAAFQGFAPEAFSRAWHNKTSFSKMFSQPGRGVQPAAIVETAAGVMDAAVSGINDLTGVNAAADAQGVQLERRLLSNFFRRHGVYGDDPDSAWNFGVGLASDILLDPTTYLTLGVGAGTKLLASGARGAPTAKVALQALAKGAPAVDGGVEVTLTRYGKAFFRASADELSRDLKVVTMRRAGERELAGQSELHLLDQTLSAEMLTRIGDHMVANFDRLKGLVVDQRAAGRLGGWSRATRWLPGSTAFETRVLAGAERAGNDLFRFTQELAGQRGKADLFDLQVTDLFQETSSAFRKDRGIGNLFGFASLANKGWGLSQRVPLVGGALQMVAKGAFAVHTKALDTFAVGHDAPVPVQRLAREYQHGLANATDEWHARVQPQFETATEEELAQLSQVLEARGLGAQTLVGARVGKVAMPRFDENRLIYDPQADAMVPNPNFGARLPDVQRDVLQVDEAVQGPMGAFAPLAPRLQKMVDVFEEEMETILAAEHAAGYTTRSFAGYVAHVYKDPRVHDLVMTVAGKNGVDSVKALNRFTQARLIATIHQVEEVFGKGVLLTDAFRILSIRKRASLELLARDQLLRDVTREHSTLEALLLQLRTGAPDGLLAAHMRRLQVGVQEVSSLDQVFKSEYGNLGALGFREGDPTFNRRLLKYLMEPPTAEGRFRPELQAEAAREGYSEDARLHSVIGRGGKRGGLPTSFYHQPASKAAYVVEHGRVRYADKSKSTSFDVLTSLRMLDDPAAVQWTNLLAQDVAQTTPELERLQGWLGGLDRYFKRYLDAPLEAVVPDLRDKIEAVWGAALEKAGRASAEEYEAGREAVKGLRREARQLRSDLLKEIKGGREVVLAPAEKKLIRARQKVERSKVQVQYSAAREIELRLRRPTGTSLEKLNNFLDRLAAPRELRKLQPQLPTPLVDYLRAQRRKFGVLTDEVPVSDLQKQELREAAVRLGFSAREMREVAEVLFDRPVTTAGQANTLIRTLHPAPVENLVPMEMQILRALNKPLYPEEAEVVGSLATKGSEAGQFTEVWRAAEVAPAARSPVGKALAAERKEALAAGEVPPEATFLGRGGVDRPALAGISEKEGEARAFKIKDLNEKIQFLTRQAQVTRRVRETVATAEAALRRGQEKFAKASFEHKKAIATLKMNPSKMAKAERVTAKTDKDALAKEVTQLQEQATAAKKLLPMGVASNSKLENELAAAKKELASLASPAKTLGESPSQMEAKRLQQARGGLATAEETPRPEMRTIRVIVPEGTRKLIEDVLAPDVNPRWPPLVKALVLGYDKFLSVTKANLVLPWSGSWMRDAASGVAMAALSAGVSLIHPVRAKGLWDLLAYSIGTKNGAKALLGEEGSVAARLETGQQIVRSVSGREATVKELYQEAYRLGILRASVRGDILGQVRTVGRVAGGLAGAAAGQLVGGVVGAAAGATEEGESPGVDWGSALGGITGAYLGARSRRGTNLLDRTTRLLQSNWAPLLRAREMMTEIPMRLAVFYNAFVDTGSIAEAAEKVHRHMNNWHSLGVIERRYLRRKIPFYGWVKTAFKHSAASMLETPGRPAAVLKSARDWNSYQHVDPEDVPDHMTNALYAASGDAEEEGHVLISGLGLPLEDTAKLVEGLAPGSLAFGTEIRNAYQEVLSRTSPGALGTALGLLSNVDDLSGESLFPNPEHGVFQTRLSDGRAFAAAPAWLQKLVRYQKATPDSRATVDPRVVWTLEGVPYSRFTNVSRQIFNSKDPRNLNYEGLARVLLGPSLYRLDATSARYYENRRRLQKMTALLSSVGALSVYQESSDVSKTDRDYRPPSRTYRPPR